MQAKQLREATIRRLSNSIVFLAIHKNGVGKLEESDVINLVEDEESQNYTVECTLTAYTCQGVKVELPFSGKKARIVHALWMEAFRLSFEDVLAMRLTKSDEYLIRPDRFVSEEPGGTIKTRTVLLAPSIMPAEDLPVPAEVASALAYAKHYHRIETSLIAWIDYPLYHDIGFLMTRYDGMERDRISIMRRGVSKSVKRKLEF